MAGNCGVSVLSPHRLVDHTSIALDDLHNLIGHVLVHIIRHRNTKVMVLNFHHFQAGQNAVTGAGILR